MRAGLVQLGILAGIALASVLTVKSIENTESKRDIASLENDSDPSFLKDFDYHLTDLKTFDEAQRVYDSLDSSTLENDFALQCGNRAHVWAWQMNKNFNINSGKLYLYYTPASFNYTGMLWGVHVVPYVIIDGKEYVMEKVREYALGPKGYFLKTNLLFSGPVLLSDWLQKLTGFSSCRDLSISNPADRPIHEFFKDVWKIQTPENCILQKAPMNYVWPVMIHQKVFRGTNPPTLNRGSALESCRFVMKGRKMKDRRKACEDFI